MSDNINCVIFDIKKYAIHDGAGIRTTLFLKGCPLSCLWCHNPEGIDPNPHIVYDKKRCIGCMECIDSCHNNALSLKPDGVYADNEHLYLCNNCSTFSCSDVCSTKARERVGKIYTVKNLLEIIQKDTPFYETSGGGVTFSGGEPLMQWKPLIELLRSCSKMEIHTAVDTSGFASWTILEQVAEFTDLFLFDLKIMDDQKHRFYTGVSNQRILENLEKVALRKNKITIRIPLIHGINDDDENTEAIGKFISNLSDKMEVEADSVKDVSLLPYHDFQQSKYVKFGINYRLQNILPPTSEQIKRVQQGLEAFGLKVSVG